MAGYGIIPAMKDYLIIANGDFLLPEKIQQLSKDKVIIALDGAANRLAALNIHPHIVLGDFDSTLESQDNPFGIKKTFNELTEQETAYQGKHGVTIVPAKNQTLTDLVKAIHYCDTRQARTITLICATGGRLDHHQAAIKSLEQEYKKDRPILLINDIQQMRYLRDESITVHGNPGSYCSIFPSHQARFTTTGLLFDVIDFMHDSVSNVLRTDTAAISVSGGAWVVMPLE